MRRVMRYFGSQPELVYLRALTGSRVDALRKARARRDLGASAIELAIITAILAIIAVGLVAIIRAVVSRYSSSISSHNP